MVRKNDNSMLFPDGFAVKEISHACRTKWVVSLCKKIYYRRYATLQQIHKTNYIMHECAYLIGIAFLFLLLLLFLLIVKKSRRLVLCSAIVWAPAGPILEYWHLQDYWTPCYVMPIQFGNWRFGVEDFLIGFAVAGLCVGLFDLMIKESNHKEERIDISGVVKILVLPIFVGPIGMFILSSLIGLNSLSSIVLLGISITILILIKRPMWIAPAFITGVIAMAACWFSYYIFFLRFFPYIIDAWWHKTIIEGVSVGGVPLEELVWAMMAGFFFGPVCRFFLVSD